MTLGNLKYPFDEKIEDIILTLPFLSAGSDKIVFEYNDYVIKLARGPQSLEIQDVYEDIFLDYYETKLATPIHGMFYLQIQKKVDQMILPDRCETFELEEVARMRSINRSFIQAVYEYYDKDIEKIKTMFGIATGPTEILPNLADDKLSMKDGNYLTGVSLNNWGFIKGTTHPVIFDWGQIR